MSGPSRHSKVIPASRTLRRSWWIFLRLAWPVPVVGICPRPVEDIFAVRVALHVERHRAGERAVLFQQKILRPPALGRRRTAGLVKRVQEFVAEEGMAARERIPFGSSHAGDR